MNDYTHNTLHELTPTTSERDLGITISADAKWHNHASTIASKANSVLGWFKSSFMSREPELWKKLYSTYIRPHLEFAAPAWNLYSKQDIDRVEKVQRRATKVSHNLKQFSYEKRLELLGLTKLEDRRRRGDCIQKYKLDTQLETVEWTNPPLIIEPMRGHPARLRRELVHSCEQRHHFFTNRIVSQWNGLPRSAVASTSTNQFKNNYDRFILATKTIK